MITVLWIIGSGLRIGINTLGKIFFNNQSNAKHFSHTEKKRFERKTTTTINLEKLILTPLLKSSSTNEILAKSAVDLEILSDDPEVSALQSYSAYFTVDPIHNSNMFFWFFPAITNPSKVPLVLWLNGGPGSSSLKGLFVEHGPIQLNSENKLIRRENSLVNNFSVLYVDSPVGAGFSFTENEKSRSKTLEDVNHNFLCLLDQFFLLFSEYQHRDFYICGESFGGKYIPSLAMAIHNRNQDPKWGKINLVGFSIGAPWIHPIHQTEHAEYLYNNGLIDPHQRDFMLQEEYKLHKAIDAKNWHDCQELCNKLILDVSDSHFGNFSGYCDISNVLVSSADPKFAQYDAYMELPIVRHTIHAGDTPFHDFDAQVAKDFINIIFVSQRENLMKLLDLDYKILIYSSQHDTLCPWTTIHKVIEQLDWKWKQEFSQFQRKIWKVNGTVAGYVRKVHNLLFVHVLNAGHLAFVEQPIVCVEMMERFIQNVDF